MAVSLALRSTRAGEWHITSDGIYLVGFSGPHAHELAEQRCREIAELLGQSFPPAPDRDHGLIVERAHDE